MIVRDDGGDDTTMTAPTMAISALPAGRDGFRPLAGDPHACTRHPPTAGGRRRGRIVARRPPEWATIDVDAKLC